MGSSSSVGINELLNAGKVEEACEKIWSEVIQQEDVEKLNDLDIEINNIVFEGGGTKCVAYCGALKLMEEAGLLKNVKRFAGTSAGSYFALKLCLGQSLDQILYRTVHQLVKRTMRASRMGFVWNFLKKFGWDTGEQLLTSLKEEVADSTGNPDTTFYEWYRKTGRELCVTIVNVSTGCVEYCHPKTTPDMSMALAVRISMGFPILYQPFTSTDSGSLKYFCDGGLLDNYPIQVYDGWYLSMETENSFFHKMGSKEEPFEGTRDKTTMGLLVFDAEESQKFREIYIKRYGDKLVGERPDTPLARQRAKRYDEMMKKEQQHTELVDSSKFLLTKLSDYDLDKSGDISLEEFKGTIDKMYSDTETRKHLVNIFGTLDLDVDKLFKEADLNQNGSLSFPECMLMLQKAGSPLRNMMSTSVPVDIASLGGYMGSIFAALDNRLTGFTAKEEDTKRSIGIYTDYVSTTDTEALWIEDKIYVIKQGWRGALCYFTQIKDGTITRD